MITLWTRLSEIGLHHINDPIKAQNLILANRLGVFVFLMSLLTTFIYATMVPWNAITTSIPIVGTLTLLTLTLNAWGKFDIARLWICIWLPVGGLAVSLFTKKLPSHAVQISEFYDFRIIMLASAVFPFILFDLKEKKPLITSILVTATILIFYDLIHTLAGVGYYAVTKMDLTYYNVNIAIIITYIALLVSIRFFKKSFEVSEQYNQELITALKATKENLEKINAEMEVRNQEMLAQSEILNNNQLQLSQAYELIEKQKELLSRENKNLEYELLEKNKELTQSNSELIKHNTELRQFSYAVSHNLRGPIASLLGLINLIDQSSVESKHADVLHHIKISANQLDAIIKDLNKIIDIRHDIFRIRQKIEVKKEIQEIRLLFQKKLEAHGIVIEENLQVPVIYSVKPMIHSILYNLISNSIKYRAADRPLQIKITTAEDADRYVIQVTDNGLGIDLSLHGNNLFRLYKRFHLHTEGKGLGLYLVKLQCESLGGSIEVESKINDHTTFTAFIKKPENISRQLLYSESAAKIFYDAKFHATGVVWNGPVSSDEYRKVFVKCLELLKVYATPNWISDITHQGPVSIDDLKWMVRDILSVATSNGLKRIALIKPESSSASMKSYVNTVDDILKRLHIEYKFVLSFEEACQWIEENDNKSHTTQ